MTSILEFVVAFLRIAGIAAGVASGSLVLVCAYILWRDRRMPTPEEIAGAPARILAFPSPSERKAQADLYPTRGRDVLATPKSGPATHERPGPDHDPKEAVMRHTLSAHRAAPSAREEVDWFALGAQVTVAERGPSDAELARLRRDRPCWVCGGSGAEAGPDSFGEYDLCDHCDGSGIDGGI